VFALENGTQGWLLAGLQAEHGARRRYPEETKHGDMEALRRRARRVADASGARFVSPDEAHAWLADGTRTTFLFDVRTHEEFAASGVTGFVHAPGGQLIQATDQWVGVKGARIVILDREEIRAPVVAGWLRQLGHQAFVVGGGTAAAAAHDWRRTAPAPSHLIELEPVSAAEAAQGLHRGTVRVLDLRTGMNYRTSHIAGAAWTVRPRIAADVAGTARTIILVADDPAVAALAATDLAVAGKRDIRLLAGGFEAWRSAGLPVESTPDRPSDADCIDFLFFTHDRQSNPDAARQYLAWETGLIGQLDDQERGVFRPLHGT
jgi:cysteine-S-conjugate beta-lyase